MKRVIASLKLIAAILLATPAQAAWVVTAKGSAVTSSSANVTVASQTYTAGSVIWLFGVSRGSTSADVLTLTGSVTGAISSGQVYICAAGGSANKVVQAWVYAAGGAETWTMNNSAGAVTGMSLRTVQIDGAHASSAEDTAARHCTTGNGIGTISITSGNGSALSETGELVVSVVGRIGSSMGYTEDAAWTQTGSENGSGNIRDAGGYKEAPSTSAVTHAPSVTQSNSNHSIMAFKAASAPPAASNHGLALMGCCN